MSKAIQRFWPILLCGRYATREIDKADVEYVIDCAEGALCGDMNQRGGGNFLGKSSGRDREGLVKRIRI